ncbi:MAG TPA: type IV pili twitching motility protein PilT, partial [Candidatus Paceibacterota bacterium]|nr:type IV pili twitching motility protein PilT [Candidatus Paceibacterota bacterium]
MLDIKTILEAAIENKTSDVHINVGMSPVLRKDTELIDMDCPPVTNADARAMLQAMVGPEKMKKFDENRDLDFSTQVASGHRFRVNAHVQRDTVALSFRVIPNQV